jgi:hypothetical protein
MENAEFVEDDEVRPRQMLGRSVLVPAAGLEPVDEGDNVIEPTASGRPNATARDQRSPAIFRLLFGQEGHRCTFVIRQLNQSAAADR